MVEGYAAVPARPGTTLQVLGVDPFAEAPFRTYVPAVGGAGNLGRLLTEPGSVLLLSATADNLGIHPGDSLELEIGGQRRTVMLRGYLQPGDEVAARALEGLLVTDIATAQEFLGETGKLSRIDLLIPEGEGGEELLARVRSLLPASATMIVRWQPRRFSRQHDRSLPPQPDRPQPAGDGGRHVSHLQHLLLFRPAAARTPWHFAHAGGDAAGTFSAGPWRGRPGRRSRYRPWPSAWPGAGQRLAASGHPHHQRPVFRSGGAASGDHAVFPRQGGGPRARRLPGGGAGAGLGSGDGAAAHGPVPLPAGKRPSTTGPLGCSFSAPGC